MRTWLVCKRCGTKEWLQPHTELVGCPDCSAPRFAENDGGDPMFIFSELDDLTSWDLPKSD